MAAPDGAANAVPQVFARFCPVGLHALFADEGLGNLTLRCAGKRAVERSKDEAKALATLLGRKQSGGELSLSIKGIETFESPHAVFQLRGVPDRVGAEPNRKQDICARHGELEVPIGIPQQDVLTAVGSLQDRDTTW